MKAAGGGNIPAADAVRQQRKALPGKGGRSVLSPVARMTASPRNDFCGGGAGADEMKQRHPRDCKDRRHVQSGTCSHPTLLLPLMNVGYQGGALTLPPIKEKTLRKRGEELIPGEGQASFMDIDTLVRGYDVLNPGDWAEFLSMLDDTEGPVDLMGCEVQQ